MSKHAAQLKSDTPKPDQTRIRYLTPDTCRIYLGTHKALHVEVKGEWVYGGVYAAYAFPVAHPEKYISLIQSIGDSKDVEIGLIRDLNDFPSEQADLIREALARRYFVHKIMKIHEIAWKYNLIHFDVETDKGRRQFFMRWKSHRAVDYGRRGKVLIDMDDNRYLIPDLDQLSPKEHSDFTRFIYW